MKFKQVIIAWSPEDDLRMRFFSNLQLTWAYKRRHQAKAFHPKTYRPVKKIKVTIQEL